MNSVTINEIFAEVKGLLRSYDEVGLIDEAFLMPYVIWMIHRSGYRNLKKYPLIINIEDFKAELPFNFKSLIGLYKCDPCNTSENVIKERYFLGLPHTFEVQDWTKKICYNKCEIEEEKEVIRRTIYIENERKIDSFCNKELLEYSGGVNPSIAKICPNLKINNKNKFNFDDKYLYFTFETGSVLLYYNGIPLDDNNYPIIEDNPYLLKAIVDYLIYQSLRVIYYNGDYDVLQRMQHAEKEHLNSMSDMLVDAKMPTYQDSKTYFKNKEKAYKIFNLKGVADAYRTSSAWNK